MDLAKALKVSADELLGLKSVKEKAALRKARSMKRLEKVEKLPAAQQRAVLKFVKALVASRRPASSDEPLGIRTIAPKASPKSARLKRRPILPR